MAALAVPAILVAAVGMPTAALAAAEPCAAASNLATAAPDSARRRPSDHESCRTIDIDEVDVDQRAWQFVDSRSNAQPIEARVPGAKPAGAFEGVSLERSNPVLIIGSGWDAQADRAACGAMRENGFSEVVVLRGGIRAWAEAERPLWGDVQAQDAMGMVSPAEAHAAALRGDMPLVVLSTPDLAANCPASTEHVRCVASMDELAQTLRGWSDASVVAVALPGQDVASFRQRSHGGSMPSDVVAVSGGAVAMGTHFQHYRDIAESSSQVLWIPCHRR